MRAYKSHKVVLAAKILAVTPTYGINDELQGAALHLDSGDQPAGLSNAVDLGWIIAHSPDMAARAPFAELAGGYFVQYADGYTSWSPAEAFEEGYTLASLDPKDGARDFGAVTLRRLQATQPWTIPYNSAFEAASVADKGLGHLKGTHAVLHAQKTIGQLAAIFETMDHTGWGLTAGHREDMAGKSADLVTAAMRLANLYQFDLAEALVTRSEEKNNVTLDW